MHAFTIPDGHPAPAWQPTLEGPTLRSRPLRADDLEPLYAPANDPELWAQHPEPTRWQRPAFETFCAGALACGGAVVAERRDTGQPVGCSRDDGISPDARGVVIGYTSVARPCWGGVTTGEFEALMLRHAFTQVDTVWLHIARDNRRSRMAAEKIGAMLDREGPGTQDGAMVPYCRYRIDRPAAEATS